MSSGRDRRRVGADRRGRGPSPRRPRWSSSSGSGRAPSPGNAPGWMPTIARMPATGPRPIRGPGSPGPPPGPTEPSPPPAPGPPAPDAADDARRSRVVRTAGHWRTGQHEGRSRVARPEVVGRKAVGGQRRRRRRRRGRGRGRMRGSRGVGVGVGSAVAFGVGFGVGFGVARGFGVGFGRRLDRDGPGADASTSLSSFATAVMATGWRPADSLPDQRNVTPLPHDPPGRRLISWPAPPNDT